VISFRHYENNVKKLRNEGVKNFTRGVGGIVMFSLNKLFLVIYVQSVIFASFHLGKEEITSISLSL
jgi:hypothetical protein